MYSVFLPLFIFFCSAVGISFTCFEMKYHLYLLKFINRVNHCRVLFVLIQYFVVVSENKAEIKKPKVKAYLCSYFGLIRYSMYIEIGQFLRSSEELILSSSCCVQNPHVYSEAESCRRRVKCPSNKIYCFKL